MSQYHWCNSGSLIKLALMNFTATSDSSCLLPSLSPLLHHPVLLFTSLSYSILSAEWEAPGWPRAPPPLFPSPLAPVRAPLLGHTRQRGGPLWRSGPGIWLVRRNVWSVNEHTHTHTHTVQIHTCEHTHTQSHNKLEHTNTVEPDRLMRRNDTASLVCHRSLSHPFSPSAHSLSSSPGRMEGWTFADRTQVRRFCLPQGAGGTKERWEKERVKWKERKEEFKTLYNNFFKKLFINRDFIWSTILSKILLYCIVETSV